MKKLILALSIITISFLILEFWSQEFDEPNTRAYIVITDEFSFNADIYSDWITLYPDGVSVGPISDAKDAVNKAISLWQEDSTALGSGFDAIHKQPYYARYDAKHECWKINATIPDNVLGATPLALILNDGTVLAVWYQ